MKCKLIAITKLKINYSVKTQLEMIIMIWLIQKRANRISFRISFRINLTWLAATSRLPFKCFRNFIENPEGAKLLLLILHTYYISTDHLTLAIPFLSHGCVFQIPKARFSSRSSSGVWLNMFYYQYRIHSNNSDRRMLNLFPPKRHKYRVLRTEPSFNFDSRKFVIITCII